MCKHNFSSLALMLMVFERKAMEITLIGHKESPILP